MIIYANLLSSDAKVMIARTHNMYVKRQASVIMHVTMMHQDDRTLASVQNWSASQQVLRSISTVPVALQTDRNCRKLLASCHLMT